MSSKLPSDNELTENNLKGNQIWKGTREDFSNSWRLLKENYKAFLGTELFAMLAFALSLGIIFLVFSIIVAFIPGFQWRNFENQLFLFNGFRTIAIIILVILIGAYMNCQNGLAWEIMSSGDMFTQLKKFVRIF